jgi:putative nucleotidyltransferase with HDIG domain
MPKRLLFVDDDVMLLNGLRRALHGMRNEWNMKFVTSAAEALHELDEESYDAIITDMRMPHMDGAELLAEVKKRHESVVRIVLSGQSNKEIVFRSIDPTHQFLSKPCNLDELKMRLSLSFSTRDLLVNPALKTIVTRLRTIPSLPLLYNELTEALQDPSTSLARLEQIIEKDVAMATKVLQLANSAFIGVRGQVSSLLQAVALIGTEAICTLALSVRVFSRLEANSAHASYITELWEHSVKVATLARQIACSENQEKQIVEQSFTAGLLHDVGKAVLLAEMPDEYRRILDHPDCNSESLVAIETELLGCSHAQVGAYLMSIWGLPAPLVHAVALHHQPMDDAQTLFSSLAAVHCADAIVAQNENSPLNRDIEMDMAYIKHLGLCEKVSAWRNLFTDQSTLVADGGWHG